MSISYQIFRSESEGSGLTILFSDGTPASLDSNHPAFAEVVLTLTTTPADAIDETALHALLTPGLAAGAALTRLSERVTTDGANIYFDGDSVDGAIANHIIRILHEGGNVDSYQALVKFLEKISQNPSQNSRDSLYDFIIRHGITISRDGDFLVYKGVRADGRSISSGFGIVNNVPQTGQLLNDKGTIIEMPRSKVDADTAVGCSTGLHAGTYHYAKNFAQGMLLLVKVNPRDVVSVPADCSFQKIRTARYEVIEQTELEIQHTTWSAEDDDYEDDDYEDDYDYDGYVGREDDEYPEDEEEDYDIDAVEDTMGDDLEFTASFDFIRANGSTGHVDDLKVKEITFSKKGNRIIVGERTDGEVRNYRVDRTSNHIFVAHEVTPVPAPVPVNVLDSIITGVKNGDEILINFNYVKLNGEPRQLADFLATDVKNGLLIGEREDGDIRTYRIDRITNASIA